MIIVAIAIDVKGFGKQSEQGMTGNIKGNDLPPVIPCYDWFSSKLEARPEAKFPLKKLFFFSLIFQGR